MREPPSDQTRSSSAARNSRKRNAYPLAPSFPGSTRWLASNNSSAAILPKASRSANSGTGRNAGRPSTDANTLVNSALRTGFGATKFTGPLTGEPTDSGAQRGVYQGVGVGA